MVESRSVDALRSLYGDGHVNATRTRECVAMPGTRDQVVRTPRCVIDGLRALWPEGIAYDPAHAEGSLVGAEETTDGRGLLDPWPHRTYCNPPFGKSLFYPEHLPLLEMEMELRAEAKAHKRKSIRWPPGLPVRKAGLRDWLDMQRAESQGESVLLAPNRTNRAWLREWRRSVDGLVELDPLTFEGWPGSFPAPLVLGFVAPPTHDTPRRVDAFHAAFAHLGDPA